MENAVRYKTPSPSGSLVERLFYYADTDPSHCAITAPAVTLSYSELARLVRAQADAFMDAGISGDSTIGIKCIDDVQHLVLCLAAIHIGATSCTIPVHDAEDSQRAIINRCGATHIIETSVALGSKPMDKVGDATIEHSPAPDAFVLFSTSGTTGEPKLVILGDRDLVAQAHRHVESSRERFACLASMNHNFAKRHRLYCLAVGATNVFLGADRQSLVAECHSLKVTTLHVSAYQAQELLGLAGMDGLSGIQLKLGGSHVPIRLRQQLRNSITPNLRAGYGTTETGAIAFTDPDDAGAGESVGRPLPGIEIRAVSPERKPLDTGERGELAVRCKGMFRGYLGNADLTAARLEDGWFYTGDLGYLDNSQRIHLCGRIDDMFVFNSMNIYPQDIESEIRQYPGVTDVAVLPKTSPTHGNIPVALVVFSGNAKKHLPALKKFVRKRVGVRSPRQYIFVDKIPTNPSGKTARREALSLPIKADQVRSDVIDMLDSHAIRHLKRSAITAFKNGDADIALRKIDMDSLARMEFLLALETDYDTVITPREFNGFRYLGSVVSRILSPTAQAEPERLPVERLHPGTLVTSTDSPPYVVRFFQRVFVNCHSVVQLSKALSTLDNRLTPMDVEHLYDWHSSGRLLPEETAQKFRSPVSDWLRQLKELMLKSGKHEPEPFDAHRVAPAVTLFAGSGIPAEKTLLICFTPSGGRNLMMPNAALLQHINARHFDLLIIPELLNAGYRRGVPHLGRSLPQLVEWLVGQDWIGNYRRLRTLGFSAGALPAVVAGCRINAEIAVSVGGRFDRRRHIARNLTKIVSLWSATRRGRSTRILLTYAADDVRDRNYAQIIGTISGGSKVAIEFTDEEADHLVLRRLLDRNELGQFLARTILRDSRV